VRALAAAAAGLLAAGCGGGQRWRTYQSPSHAYRVDMPGTPEPTLERGDGGEVTEMATFSAGDMTYMTASIKGLDARLLGRPELVAEALTRAVMGGSDAAITPAGQRTREGVTTLDFELSRPTGKPAKGRLRALLDRNSGLFFVLLIVREGAAMPGGGRFFSSFEITQP